MGHYAIRSVHWESGLVPECRVWLRSQIPGKGELAQGQGWMRPVDGAGGKFLAKLVKIPELDQMSQAEGCKP